MSLTSKLWEIKKKNDLRPEWYSILINPYFLIRRGLYEKIKSFAASVKKARIIDVGCGERPYENLFLGSEYAGIDIEGGGHKKTDKKPDKYFDGENIPYGDGEFDVALCTEVFEHSPEPEKLAAEIARVLKKGGRLYASVPFVWNEHEAPYDFRRFTSYGLKRLLEKDFEIKSIKPTIGLLETAGQLLSAAIIESFKKKNFITYPLIALVLCFPIQLIFLLLGLVFRSRWITAGWTVVAMKK